MKESVSYVYNIWKNNADEETKKELENLEFNEKEIEERFYKDLNFGTAGLSVFFFFWVKTYVFENIMPVPMLSFAVRELNCDIGVMITASHNPAEYNGYKVYGADGSQIGEEVAKDIYLISQDLDFFNDVKTLDFYAALKEGKIKYIERQVIEKYYEEVLNCLINKDILKTKNFSVLYTPLNGSGNVPVREVLARLNVKDVFIVKEQEQPDENFTTCAPPNPETKEALSLGLKYCKEKKPDVFVATDPDCDRVGVAVFKDREKEDYVILNGNEIGILMFYYICTQRSLQKTFPKNPVAVKTIVSSSLVEEIAKDYSVSFKNVLTGFKYIGEQIKLLELKKEQERFIFGFEESHGYLAGSYVRDKDGVFAASFLCEIVAFYKQKNMLIPEVLREIYEKYGYCRNKVESFVFDGKQGMQNMENIMAMLREKDITKIGELKINKRLDYLKGIEVNLETKEEKILNLNRSNVLQYVLENKSSIIVRPSGTEPKIKIYYSVLGKTKEQAKSLEEYLIKSFNFKENYV